MAGAGNAVVGARLAGGVQAFATGRPIHRRVQLRTRQVIVRAEGGSNKEVGSFDAGDDAKYRTGYTEADSAGQSNVFGLEPKMYVAGSAADTKSTEGFTLQSVIVGVGIIIAAVGASFIVAGFANVGGDLETEREVMSNKSLSTFVTEFQKGSKVQPSAAAVEEPAVESTISE